MKSDLLVGEIAEPRQIKPSRPPVVERARLADQVFHEAGDSRPHHVLAKIVADVREFSIFESSINRADSSVEAPKTTTFAFA